MQCDRGLSGAGPALHDQGAGHRGPDDRVLLDLDRLDDVGHGPGAAGVQRGQQRRLARQALVPGRVGGSQVEYLVVHADELPAPGPQMPPDLDLTRRRGRGQVKRPGRLGPPVHQQLDVVVGVSVDSEPSDIAEFAVVELEPPEAEAVLRGVQLSELLAVHHAEVVAFEPGLVRAAGLPQHGRHPGAGAFPEIIQPAVKHSDVILLAL